MKKALAVLLTLAMLVSTMTAMTLPSSADTVQSGTWGNLSWTFNETTGELTISGEGAMKWDSLMAWKAYRNSIKSITIEEGITNISASAFYNCNITTLDLPNLKYL